MDYRAYIPHRYSTDSTDRSRDRLDRTLPVPEAFDDLPGGANGAMNR